MQPLVNAVSIEDMSDDIIEWRDEDLLSLIEQSCCLFTGTLVSLATAQDQCLLRISIFRSNRID